MPDGTNPPKRYTCRKGAADHRLRETWKWQDDYRAPNRGRKGKALE